MKVLLKVAGEYQIAHCDFATATEVELLTNWSDKIHGRPNQATADALEFASLARKRWQSYIEMNRTAQTTVILKKKIAADPTVEVAMLAVLRLHRMPTTLLGFCLFRRTWCNHLIVDLLAANPSESGEVARVGASLVYFIATIAQ